MGATIPDPLSPVFLSGWLLRGVSRELCGWSVLSPFPVKQEAKPSAERWGKGGRTVMAVARVPLKQTAVSRRREPIWKSSRSQVSLHHSSTHKEKCCGECPCML